MKKTSILFVCMIALVALAAWAPNVGAYERYKDNNETPGSNCSACHGNFTDNTSTKESVFPSNNKHEMHRGGSSMDTDCDLCHTNQDGRNAFIGSSNGTVNNPGVGCVGCHGRQADAGNDSISAGRGAGLRQHHWVNGVTTTCGNCHSDSNPANYTPVGENVFPPYYGTVDTFADEPCNTVEQANINENWTIGDFVGSDNDGDNAYDGADSDCAVNNAPVADAGPNQTVFVTDTVTLDGSGSSDADGDALSFSWSLTTVPAGSAATLSDPNAVNPTFDVDEPGTYVAQLIVNDGTVDSDPDTVNITTDNSPPVADAGPNQTVFVTDTVTLDGSGSSDADGDALSFSWSLTTVPAGSAATLSDPNAVNPTFDVDEPGTYVAQLIVNDGTVDSDPDTVNITTDNSPPVADAGPNQTVFVTDTVTLDGSGSSDADGDALSFSWSLTTVPAGSAATLSDPNAVNPTFDVDEPGTYVAQLIVNDGTVDSDPDTVNITTDNSPPVADAGPNQTVFVTDTVTLDGSGSSDADGDALSFSWSLTTVPAGSAATLSDPNAVNPTFDVDEPGTYVAQLIVNDGTVDSDPDTVNITTDNSPPVADAGPNQTVFVTDTVTLDGSGSSDADGDALSFSWSLTTVPAGSAATLSDPNAVNPTFDVDEPGTYVAQLIVNDGTVDSDPDTVNITTDNSPPVADAGPNQTVFVTDTVTLDGSGSSDADGDALSFSWSLTTVPAGSAATLSDPNAVNPTFDVDEPGTYVAQLIVNDGTVDSDPDTVNITTDNSPPVADAGPNQTVFVTDTVTLDGSGSSDADGDALSFSWSLTTVPAGSAATLSDPNAVNPTFDVDEPGTYVAQLIVNDGTVDSDPDTVNITTDNSPPVADAGPNQTVFVTDTVTLDGSGSSDADGDALSFSWSLTTVPAGSAATLSDPNAVNPTFDVDEPGTYVAQLIVNDGTVDSDPDTVNITTDNSPPVADAGPNQTVFVTDTVTLDGSGSSDADGDALSFSWSLTTVPAGSAATLSDPNAVNPTFDVDEPGTYVAQLIVNDGTVDSDPDTVTITTDNQAPTADPNGPYTGTVGVAVTFDGSGSTDSDGTIASYAWDFGDTNTGTGMNPTHTYDAAGTYTVTLTVTDNAGDTSDPATTTATITAANVPPVADPNGPYTGTVGLPVSIDGSGSSDTDGTIVSYDWNFGDGATGTRMNPTHTYDAAGTYTVSLTVTDNDGATHTASTTATIADVQLDLDIAQFKVTKQIRLAKVKPVGITLVVKNNGTVNSAERQATVIGVQNGVEVYNKMLDVSDPVGNGRSTFTFPSYTPEAAGDIVWTATIADDDPDIDEDTAVTKVN